MAQHSWLPMGSTWTTHDTLTGWKRILENLISTINNNITTVEGDVYEIVNGTTLMTASQVMVSDTGGYFTGTNVETALAELASDMNAVSTALGGEIIEYIGTVVVASTGAATNLNFNYHYTNKPTYFVFPRCSASVIQDSSSHYTGVSITPVDGTTDTVFNFMAICSGKV